MPINSTDIRFKENDRPVMKFENANKYLIGLFLYEYTHKCLPI